MSLLAPPPRRRIVFMLTPLVDVMFLLLIFFMLASQTANYALLPIEAAGASSDTVPAEPATVVVGRGDVVVSIARGYVRFNGVRVEMADLLPAIATYKAAGFASALMLTTAAATVQDVVEVLHGFQASQFGELRLVAQRDPAP
jgi:biopolymer transport protein ExbD